MNEPTQGEEVLLKAGALQRAIFNSANFSSIATDAHGVIQIFNVGAERMLGYTAAEVIDKVTPADISDAQEVIARAEALSLEFRTPIAPGFEALVFKASRGIEDIYELTYIRKDGTRLPAVVSITALRDAREAVIGYLLIGTDNIARKQAEEDLLKAGALQRAIFNSANFSSIATDAHGVIQIFNVGAERMLGYTAAEVINKVTPADISDAHEVIARAEALSLEFGTPITPGFEALVFKASRGIEDIYELTYVRKDSSRFPAVVSVTALRDAQDAIIGYLLIGTDNSARMQAEEDLRESAKRLGELAAIVASSDDVILSKDLDGTVTSWNAAATRVFGYTPAEMIGRSILELIPEHLHSDEKAIIENIRAGRRVEHFETIRLTKDGRLIDVSLTVSPIKDERGQVVGASKILRDISSRKRIEQSLLQAEKIAATGRMAATIAHEINNPLEAVMNLLFLLREKITDDEGIGYLATAEDELGRVSHIAKQTLGYYREHAAASPASLSEIAEHALTMYAPRCTAAGIAIRKSLSSSTKVVLRRGEMMQVISNLIANSIYAMSAGGTLSVSVKDETSTGDGIVLTIQDNGVGIAPDVLPKIFEAFFTTRATVGTGIGLFVAKQFVEGHRGWISIESNNESENHGTTVHIFLPLHTAYT
jgi:PAS domain S-box-containing protein